MENYFEQFCVGSKQFICLNFLIVIGQEGYLFHLNADKLQVIYYELFEDIRTENNYK